MNLLDGKLRDYQIEPVRKLVHALDTYDGLLDASDMGVGKTFVALATALATNRRPVVVCRGAAIPSWERCAEHFGIRGMVTVNYESIRTGNTPLGDWRFHRKKVADPKKKGESIEKKIERFDWYLKPYDLLTFDEVHWCKGQDTANAELLISARAQQIKTLCLSATAANNPMHMKALGYAIGLHDLKDYYPWMMANGVNRTKFGFAFYCGMKFWEIKRDPGRLAKLQALAMRGIHHQIFNTGRGIRIQKKDVPGFPKDIIIPIPIDFGLHRNAIGGVYADLHDKLRNAKSDKKFALMMAAQMEIERLKVPGLIDEARNMIEDGRHVALFVNYNETVDALCKGLKTKCCIRGEQDPVVRQKNIDDFQADIEEVIICNGQAGGESIGLHDLHGNFPRGAIHCPSFWAEKMVQCFGRIPRNGGLTDCVQKVPFAAGTIEEESMRGFERKCGNIAALNDGDLAPEWLSKFLQN